MKKISTKIILLVIILIVLIITGTSFFIYSNMREIIRRDAEKSILKTTEIEAKKVERKIKNIELLSENLKTLVLNTMDYDQVKNDASAMDAYEDEISPTFLSIIKNFNNPSGWMVFDSEDFTAGHVISWSLNAEGKYARNPEYDVREGGYVEDAWWKKAVEEGSWWTAPYYWETWDEDIITYSIPVKIDGEVIATTGGEFYFDELKEEVASVKILDTGYMTLLDQNFNTLYHPDPEAKSLKTVADGSLKHLADKIASSDQKTDIIEYELNGEKKIWVYYKLSNGWIISAHPVIEEMFAELNATRKNILMVAIVAILLGAIVSFLIANSLSKPIVTIQNKVEKASQGDLTESFELKSKDEIGQMSQSLNQFIEKLNSIIMAIKDVINHAEEQNKQIQYLMNNIINGEASEFYNQIEDRIDIGIMKLSDSMKEALGNVQNQVAGTEETLAGLEEVSSSTVEVSKNSNKTLELSKETTELAESSSASVNNMNQEMQMINKNVEETNNRIGKLTDLSKDIGGIVTTINDLSEQTNLLALNAAIEAARAGDAGKGFAVVADEVRKLAEQTNQETEKIEGIIKNIQSEIGDVNNSNNKVIGNVKEGLTISEKVTDEINNIIEIARKNERAIQGIARSSEEQSEAITEMTDAVAEIASDAGDIEKTNMSNVEVMRDIVDLLNEKYETINEINETFEKLQTEINFFNLKNE